MFDEKFCLQLEYAISGALPKSLNIDWRRCWCDGVLLPDNEEDYLPEQILKTKEVVTKAWIDEGRIKGGGYLAGILEQVKIRFFKFNHRKITV